MVLFKGFRVRVRVPARVALVARVSAARVRVVARSAARGKDL